MSENTTTQVQIDPELETLETETPETEETPETQEMTLEQMIQDLVDQLPEEITPYAIHTVINGIFDAFEIGKEIRPQMMYNYDRNGLIVKGSKGKKRYTRTEVTEFVTRYVKKHI